MIKDFWPEWELCEELGRGSYGVVYSAVRKVFGEEHKAAIKIITIPSNEAWLGSEDLDSNDTRKYLHQIVNEVGKEIHLMMLLQGKTNVVSIQDYKVVEKPDDQGWDIYIRMEQLTPLDKYIKLHALTEEEILKLGIDICTALELCAEKDIIHRDIKPANIFVDDLGNFKLGDFGIARKLDRLSDNLTYNKFSPSYVAPEVVHAAHYDARVDQYSLGIVLYQLLNNNHLPFLENEPPDLKLREEALWRRLNGEKLYYPCNASFCTAPVVLRACAHDPNKRYSSPTEMKDALRNALNGGRTEKCNPWPCGENEDGSGSPKKDKKSVFIKIVLGIILVVLIGSVCWIGFNLIDKEDDVSEESDLQSPKPVAEEQIREPTEIEPHYMERLEELSPKVLETLKDDVYATIVTDSSNLSSYETLKKAKYVGAYFLSKRESDSGGVDNCIGLIYAIDVSREEPAVGLDDTITYYFVQEYYDLYVNSDGEISMDLDDYESPRTIGDSFDTAYDYYYYGYQSLVDLEDAWVSPYTQKYICETTEDLF